MDRRMLPQLLVLFVLLSAGTAASISGQNRPTSHRIAKEGNAARLEQLVEANILAVHAYQILLAKKSSKGVPACYISGRMSDAQLEALVQHQARLLKSDLGVIKSWVVGINSNFDPAADLERAGRILVSEH